MHRVKDADGNWCDLRLTPYRTADNRIDGVVLSVLAFNEFEESPPRQTKNAAAKSKKNTQKKSSKKPTKRS
jgi:hypothetical protein